MPLLGLGVWRVPAAETEQAVVWALEAGYRHVRMGRRVWQRGGRRARAARERTAAGRRFRGHQAPPPAAASRAASSRPASERSGLDRVDLYLIHWPGRGAEALWPALERLHADGLARAIGVSNYGTDLLRRTVERAEVPPMVNQVEWHPQVWLALRAAGPTGSLGVVLESDSPLGHGRLLRDPAIAEIAGRVGRTPAQVLVRWCLQRGVPTIPKSRSRERIVENAQVLDWALGEEDMARLDALRGG